MAKGSTTTTSEPARVQDARDGDYDHMLTCGPCNGFPELGSCIRSEQTCRTCGRPCRKNGQCRQCAVESWKVSQ